LERRASARGGATDRGLSNAQVSSLEVKTVLAGRLRATSITRRFTTLSYQRFTTNLKSKDGGAAACLRFTILTVCRTNERTKRLARGGTSSTQRRRRVPGVPDEIQARPSLPARGRGRKVIERSTRLDHAYVFPGVEQGTHLSNMGMLKLFRGMDLAVTVHGFRLTFGDWTAETTNIAREVIEMALAHAIADQTEAAYRRGDLFASQAHETMGRIRRQTACLGLLSTWRIAGARKTTNAGTELRASLRRPALVYTKRPSALPRGAASFVTKCSSIRRGRSRVLAADGAEHVWSSVRVR
jgi:hypothetical protein